MLVRAAIDELVVLRVAPEAEEWVDPQHGECAQKRYRIYRTASVTVLLAWPPAVRTRGTSSPAGASAGPCNVDLIQTHEAGRQSGKDDRGRQTSDGDGRRAGGGRERAGGARGARDLEPIRATAPACAGGRGACREARGRARAAGAPAERSRFVFAFPRPNWRRKVRFGSRWGCANNSTVRSIPRLPSAPTTSGRSCTRKGTWRGRCGTPSAPCGSAKPSTARTTRLPSWRHVTFH